MKVLYTAEALATGEGRDGHVRTTDGQLDLDLAAPRELGGAGGAANPELLFAAGYAACFHSALRIVARRAKADITDSQVTARVGIGPSGTGGYGLTVELLIHLPAVDPAVAEQIVARADQVCPYSNAVRGNVEVSKKIAAVAR